MELSQLASNLKFANEVGNTLNIDERMKLEVSGLKLNETERFDNLLFWGKIFGYSSDYYVVMGLHFRSLHSFPQKKFFFANDDFNFSELPEINPDLKQFVENHRAPFSGQREKILKEAEPVINENEQEDNNLEEEIIRLPPKNVTELDRLAYVIRTIEYECQILPVGAYKLTPTKELRINENFEGLNINDSNDIKNYQHFREPVSQKKKNLIDMGEAFFKLNFLDDLEGDLPSGSWSLQIDSSKTKVTLRNLVWPGYLGYHRANSKTFGGVYFGEGIKNLDFLFLI